MGSSLVCGICGTDSGEITEIPLRSEVIEIFSQSDSAEPLSYSPSLWSDDDILQNGETIKKASDLGMHVLHVSFVSNKQFCPNPYEP